jgi:hypothetical protein
MKLAPLAEDWKITLSGAGLRVAQKMRMASLIVGTAQNLLAGRDAAAVIELSDAVLQHFPDAAPEPGSGDSVCATWPDAIHSAEHFRELCGQPGAFEQATVRDVLAIWSLIYLQCADTRLRSGYPVDRDVIDIVGLGVEYSSLANFIGQFNESGSFVRSLVRRAAKKKIKAGKSAAAKKGWQSDELRAKVIAAYTAGAPWPNRKAAALHIEAQSIVHRGWRTISDWIGEYTKEQAAE